MKVSTILDHIDNGHVALPEFQRGYVWNREQVRGLMASLYRQHPVGGLLVWATGSDGAPKRGPGDLAPGVVKLLLDGQQRITSLYGIIRGRPPKFFDGNKDAFTGLCFNVQSEEFQFTSPVMKDDPRWIEVTTLMKQGITPFVAVFATNPELSHQLPTYVQRLTKVERVKDIDLHIEEVTGEDKTIDVVVDIFNKVNSGGTKLSKGDLALAKICADAPDARERMKACLAGWNKAGYWFDLDWLLRNVNTVVTGEAKFQHMHSMSAEAFRDGLVRAERAINNVLNLIAGRLGLDHDRVFFGRYALPVLTNYLDRRGGNLSAIGAVERDRMLFWFLSSAMWGRFSGSTESYIDRDLELIANLDGGLDRLIKELQVWHGGLRVQAAHFNAQSIGARFYPVLYMLTRIGEAKDWGSGLALKEGMFGRMNQLEVHHVFPKARLYAAGYGRTEVNAIANFCFLTKDTNLKISDRRPEEYFPKIEAEHPGALASQWIPMDPALWKLDRYRDFLEARRGLLAEATNAVLAALLHSELPLAATLASTEAASAARAGIPGSVDSEQEEQELSDLNAWVRSNGLAEGTMSYELCGPTGSPVAVLDLAWPVGLQPGLGAPVCVLLNEPAATLEAANTLGYRYFTSAEAFKRFVSKELLGQVAAE